MQRDSVRRSASGRPVPFKSLAEHSRDESLELGIADALITRPGQFRAPHRSPDQRNPELRRRGSGSLAAGRDLAVDAVLDGTSQRSTDRLRITARLVRTSDAVTLWAGRYHETLASIFDVQDAIADKITAALELKLAGRDTSRPRKRYTQNPEVYRLYVNGRYNFTKGSEESLRKAINFFYEAIAVDPQYTLAYVGVADAYTFLDWYGVLSTREANPQAFAAAGKALTLDPELAEAHASMGLARQHRWDWTGAEESFRRSIALNPTYAPARQWFAVHLSFRGRGAEALAEIRQAQELDPMSLAVRAQRGLILYFRRRFEDAIIHCSNALRVEPAHDEARLYLALSLIETGSPDAAIVELKGLTIADTPDVQAMLARALAVAGHRSEAEAIVNRLVAGSATTGYIPHLWIAAAYVTLDNRNTALRQLEAASRIRTTRVPGSVSVFFDPLRAEPRFLVFSTTYEYTGKSNPKGRMRVLQRGGSTQSGGERTGFGVGKANRPLLPAGLQSVTPASPERRGRHSGRRRAAFNGSPRSATCALGWLLQPSR